MEAHTLGKRSLREVIASSPWVTISVLLHVILVASLTVVYLAGDGAKEPAGGTQLSFARAPLFVPPPPMVDAPPPELRRTDLPWEPDLKSGPENPDPEFLVDADPGRKGEDIPDQTDLAKDPGVPNPDPLASLELPSGATGGTSIGIGKIGHFGLGTSSYASRLAGLGGPGGGGHGDGLNTGVRSGGPPPLTVSTLAALLWLSKHQSPDGRWDCDGFDAQCRPDDPCSGKGDAVHDVGVTGLSLLCFLGAGCTPERGPRRFRQTVRLGLRFLLTTQDEQGLFGGRSSQHYQYDHACAALAMAEAFGMTGANSLRGPAEAGVGWVLRSRNPYRAWRYGESDGDNDTSVTGWMVMVLKSAVMSELPIEKQALADAARFVEEMTDPSSGRTGYQQRGGMPARLEGTTMDSFPAEQSESTTAVGLVTRIFAGHPPASDPAIQRGAELLLSRRPKWDGGSVDFYYWYYGTLAMYQVGGASWEKWRKAIEGELIAHQRLDKSSDAYGSWDPVDPWSAEGGRVYATALNCLSTEVCYRYARVFGVK